MRSSFGLLTGIFALELMLNASISLATVLPDPTILDDVPAGTKVTISPSLHLAVPAKESAVGFGSQSDPDFLSCTIWAASALPTSQSIYGSFVTGNAYEQALMGEVSAYLPVSQGSSGSIVLMACGRYQKDATIGDLKRLLGDRTGDGIQFEAFP
jgi:predicted lipoprotein